MNAPLEDADIEAMLRLRLGEDLALNEIISRWHARVQSFLARFVGNDADALDLTQETFVKMYHNRDRYRVGGKFSTWLFAIASNEARQRLRWRKRHPETALAESGGNDQDPSIPIQSDTPSDIMERAETAAAVKNAILALPADLRQAVLLAEYEDMPQAEIAQIAGCSVKAVETRLYRARTALRKSLGELLA